MANCHQQFLGFLDEIRLNSEKRKSLKKSRHANRDRIRNYFRDILKREPPLFHGQGSYPMHTIINPLDGDCDLDDGVYLQGLGTNVKEFPKASTVHTWIVDAVSGYTSQAPQDKARCVRVRYQDDYHIDLPIYAMNVSNVPVIFDKNADEPYESDPRAFTVWFQSNVNSRGQQLRNIVRYLKAWRDQQGGAALAVSGLGCTILVVEHYVANERDDVAFAETIKSAFRHMKNVGTILKPTFPFEDLTWWWDEAKRSNVLNSFEYLCDRCTDAIEEANLTTASKIWARRVFGYRFPIVEKDDNKNQSNATVSSRAPILGNDRRSA